MIAKLTGKLDSTGTDWAIVDVNGVGYLASCSRRTLTSLGAIGSPVRLLIEVRVRDELPYLYGFADAGERDWFRLLTTVQGVGAKVALSILSVLPPEKLLLAIAAQDRAAITQADGVGPKLATRLLSELKDKAGGIGIDPSFTLPSSQPSGAGGGLTADAVSALVNLGYGRSDALATVAKLTREDDTLGDLIRRSLKELAG
jgi:Holliday junction DNA helicase RuvA